MIADTFSALRKQPKGYEQNKVKLQREMVFVRHLASTEDKASLCGYFINAST